MKALLILAHGSRQKDSNQEIMNLCHKLEHVVENDFDAVSCAFVQFTTPLFHTQVDTLVERGMQQIVILPYFIAAGSHVLSDIPELLEQARAKYPNIDFKLTPHFGQFQGIPELIIAQAKAIA